MEQFPTQIKAEKKTQVRRICGGIKFHEKKAFGFANHSGRIQAAAKSTNHSDTTLPSRVDKLDGFSKTYFGPFKE